MEAFEQRAANPWPGLWAGKICDEIWRRQDASPCPACGRPFDDVRWRVRDFDATVGFLVECHGYIVDMLLCIKHLGLDRPPLSAETEAETVSQAADTVLHAWRWHHSDLEEKDDG